MRVFGLIGEKLSHSLSPIIHSYLYEILNIDASYSLYQVKPELLEAAVNGIRALDLSGVNVTIPYKVKIMEQLDNISAEALKIGAINTILNKDSVLTGYNTDYIGFGRTLNKHQIDVASKTVVVLGSGGAAKSVVAYLEDAGVSHIYIVTRDPNKTFEFNTKHSVISYQGLDDIKQGSLLINCTPVGMYPQIDFSPINHDQLIKFGAVVDLIYNPYDTLLMQYAKTLGIPAYNGLYMLVSQAAAAVEIWNDIEIHDATVDVVFNRLIEYMNK